MTPEDDVPFIRCSNTRDIQIALIVTNSAGGVVNDLCNTCKTGIVTDGRTIEQIAVEGRKVVEIDSPATVLPTNLSTRTSAGGASRPLPYEPSLKPKTKPTEKPEPKPEGT
jgi:hypothetical protein